ncbi:MAG TPA: Asp-tRNA(Asn)/Glu-tRNA(Gln) amidotransferase subunit GatA [Candidatus Paceibacterota bacterium]
MERFFQFSIRQIHDKLLQKEFSAREIAQAYIRRAKERDGGLNAFLTQTPELALEQAKKVDEKIAAGQDIGQLAGIPIAIKDSIFVRDVRCTAASRILENYIAPYDATVVKKLRDADAMLVGKTNTDEFNMGASTENSAFGVTKNPHDPTRVAGGSSGGSAAAVASSQAHVALGADTGGSIRLPAAFCGVVGMKPTYGAVSRHGLIAMASSLDQIGPLAKRAEDAELVFQAISGHDNFDATSLRYQYTPNEHVELENIRIGIPEEYFAEGIDPAVEKRIRQTIEKLAAAGASIRQVSLPHTKYALGAYYILNTSEVSSNLARYDGIRYGESAQGGNNLLSVYTESRKEFLGKEVKRRIMLGTYALSAGYYDAYYIKAQKIRTLLKRDFDTVFGQVDCVVGPVTPFLPFKISERVADPLAMYLVDLYTVPVNLVGLPALSLPVGNVGDLPVGMHFVGKPLSESLLFGIAKATEKLL